MTAPAIDGAIVQLRCAERIGPDEIGYRLAVLDRTVSRVLVRHAVPRLAMDPITGEVTRASNATAIRYERETFLKLHRERP